MTPHDVTQDVNDKNAMRDGGTRHDGPRGSFRVRLSAYLAERFPVPPSFLTSSLMAGTADLVAQAARGTAPTVDGRTWSSIVFVFCALWVLRVLDEHKDFHHDTQIHPERMLQRGVVSLRELDVLAGIAALAMLALHGSAGVPALCGAFGCLVFMGLMRVEFFVPAFLRARLFLYALTHQGITPLLCFSVVLARHDDDSSEVTMASVLTVASVLQASAAALLGFVYEFGRKIRAPAEEILGDATYSSVYGASQAAALTAVCGALAAVAGAGISSSVGHSLAAAFCAGAGGCMIVGTFGSFAVRVRPGRAKALLGGVALGALLIYTSMGISAWSVR